MNLSAPFVRRPIATVHPTDGTILGFAMIATFLVLIMMKKMSPIAALVLIPALFCVFVGKGAKLGDYVIEGVTSLAPTAAMLMFAIVYFGVMIDVGLFDPVVRGILKFAKADPMRIVVGTAILAAIVSLDGDGSTTFMITVSAMYPLYKRLKMSLVVMTGVAAMANGVMNTLPWGGPTARAATALKLDASDIFVPMIPALANYFIAMFKETPLLSAITVLELMNQAKSVANSYYRYIEPMTLVGAFFLVISLASVILLRWLERRYGRIER